MTVVLLSGGAGAAMAAPVDTAGPQADRTIQAACLNTAKTFTSTPGSGSSNAHWPATGTYEYTTSNCADINLKLTQTRRVRTCFKATGACNGFRTLTAGAWGLAATDVKDNSGFYIQFEGTAQAKGQIAY
ncbi:hypothetical protein [Streptomyces sp. NPDC092903]|uniref:hypothetical protein n=1 Tax=Streptomyces sp. NPDC092903 TaxID=3366017 RepID=UPI00381D387C